MESWDETDAKTLIETRIACLQSFLEHKESSDTTHDQGFEQCVNHLAKNQITRNTSNATLQKMISFGKKLLRAIGGSTKGSGVNIVAPPNQPANKKAARQFVVKNTDRPIKISFYKVTQSIDDIPLRPMRRKNPFELSAEEKQKEIKMEFKYNEFKPIFFVWQHKSKIFVKLEKSKRVSVPEEGIDPEIYDALKQTKEYTAPEGISREEAAKTIIRAPTIVVKSRKGSNKKLQLAHLKPSEKDISDFNKKANVESITVDNYSNVFETCLKYEYLQNNKDMKFFRLSDHDITTKSSRTYSINVPGLMEGRPSVVCGDKVLVSHEQADKRFFGRVLEVEQNTVTVAFDTRFNNLKHGYSIDFRASLTPLRRALTSLRMTIQKKEEVDKTWLLQPVLFPKEIKVEQIAVEEKFQPNILLLNEKQELAVKSILSMPSNNYMHPYIIFGPPGTGKTQVVTEVVLRLQRHTSKRILIACPSNSSADLIAERISKNLPEKTRCLIRLNAFNRDVPKKTVEYYDTKDASSIDSDETQIVVATCSTCWTLNATTLMFDYLFLDEIGQAMEPEALIPIYNVLNTNPKAHIVLSGDPKQLGPVLHYKAKPQTEQIDTEFPLSQSLLERLCNLHCYARNENLETKYDSRAITKLVDNYRSLEMILKKPSDMFYDGELIATRGKIGKFSDWRDLPKQENDVDPIPVVFYNVNGRMLREDKSPSYFNIKECEKVSKVLESVFSHAPLASVGVITPYHKQKKKIETLWQKMKDAKNSNSIFQEAAQDGRLKIGCVEDFQGQERDVIIISTVRSGENINSDTPIGFLASPKRLNVAITRAKDLLIFIGNAEVLSTDREWKEVIDFCKEHKVLKSENS